MTFEIQLKFKGAVREDTEANVWIGYCPSLQIYSQGTNQGEAEEALKDAAMSFVVVCLQRQILEKALAKRGFVPSKESQQTSADKADSSEWIQIRKLYDKGEFEFSVSVPFHLAAAHAAA